MTTKTNALTQSAMKLGQAMYEAQQSPGAGAADAGASAGAADEPPAQEEDVVDAEFSEVDEENKA